MEWYVLQALTGREQDARAVLERAGFDARVPTELRPIHRRGQWIEQEYTLLPGYVFVEMDFEPRLYRAIKEVPGAVRLLGLFDEHPTPLPQDEAALWGLCGPPSALMPSVVAFDAYGTPRVIDGPLTGREAQIGKIARHARRARVLVDTGDERHLVRFGIRPADGDAQ